MPRHHITGARCRAEHDRMCLGYGIGIMAEFKNSFQPGDLLYPGWIDDPDAIETLRSLDIEEWQYDALEDLIVRGFTVLKQSADPQLCTNVVSDYGRYCTENRAYVDNNLDETGREKRLVNFHLWSENEMKIATNSRVMGVLDLMFADIASVYTSLTFKFGTQQPIHRDTPHFATWPDNGFCGVWTALEDVRPEAGPLMYIAGGHRFTIDQREIFKSVVRDHPNLSPTDQLMLALDIYNGKVIDEAPLHGELIVAEMQKGDVAIWHPALPHGGSPAQDPFMSRWSVVTHCAPESIQVHQHDRFFSYDGPESPPARYGYREAYGRKIAVAGETAFM